MFDMADPDSTQQYNLFRGKNPNNTLFTDTRLADLIALYRRFPQAPGFTSWLRNNDFTPPFSQKGSVLAIPEGYNNNGQITWRLIAVLPENLQRQIQEASAWKMMDSPDGAVETRKMLYDDVDLVVIGASVGSQIASTMVTALGVNHLTIVDPDTQDGIGMARVDDPKLPHLGKLKVVKLEHSLLQVAPYLKYKIVPQKVTADNVEEILKGLMPQNENRRLVIVEEIDDLDAKDLIRKTMRKLYPESGNVLLISIADVARAGVQAVIEEPEDPPYAGSALNVTQDPYGSDLAGLSKIIATYGLREMELELVNALNDLLTGKIGSFEQSGLATRLAGLVASQALLSWLEGHLATKVLNLNLANFLDTRANDPAFLKRTRAAADTLLKNIGFTETKKL